MLTFNNELGKRILERIQTEQVIWLTTISPSGIPQPRPVWFVWDDKDFIMYSTARAKKLIHISHNPNVSLHFNTDKEGYDIQVITGMAKIDETLPRSNLNKAYNKKYGAEILAMGMDEEKYANLFKVGIRVEPLIARGLEPIPEE